MIGRTLNYISHHAIAILALVCSLLALAGASYAAVAIPKNSVGTAQLKQGAVTPSKLSGQQFGGYVRMFAVVDANSKLQYSSPQAKLTRWGNSAQPNGFSFGTVSWKQTVTAKRCAAFASPQTGLFPPTSVGAIVIPNSHGTPGTHVSVSWAGDVAIGVEVVCH